MNKNRPIVLIGGGGHASVLADLLIRQQREIVAVVCPDDVSARTLFQGIPQYRQDIDIKQFCPDEVLLVNGIGMLPHSELKKKLNQYFLSLGYRFETVIAEEAIVSPYAQILSGAQIFPGAVIQTGAVIGQHSVINTGVVIEHDTCIGEYNHVAPGSIICGQVITESDVYIGANATVVQNLRLNKGSIVGAGAILTKSLPENQIAYPARTIIQHF